MTKKKILLIEDDPFLIDIYTTKFQEQGFQITVVKDGSQAVILAKKIKPEIILLDIVLPNIDGWQILKEITGEPGSFKGKIVILSNLSQREEVEKGLSLGAVKYFIKSNYTPSQVVEEIKKLV
jgi:DNA-binding response OmpR family regulator